MQLNIFFVQHPVFRHEELMYFIKQEGKYNPNTLKALLQYHLAKEHIARIRRGYYAVVSPLKSGGAMADDLLVAGRVTKDAIIGYYSALSFYGCNYFVYNSIYFCSTAPIQSFAFMHTRFQRVAHPKALQPEQIMLETQKYDREGLDIYIPYTNEF